MLTSLMVFTNADYSRVHLIQLVLRQILRQKQNVDL